MQYPENLQQGGQSRNTSLGSNAKTMYISMQCGVIRLGVCGDKQSAPGELVTPPMTSKLTFSLSLFIKDLKYNKYGVARNCTKQQLCYQGIWPQPGGSFR